MSAGASAALFRHTLAGRSFMQHTSQANEEGSSSGEGPIESCIQFLLTLPLSQRREVLAVSAQQVHDDAGALSSCPRCGFTRLILSALLPSQLPTCRAACGSSAGAESGPIAPSQAIPPDELMTLLAPKRILNLLQFCWSAEPALPAATGQRDGGAGPVGVAVIANGSHATPYDPSELPGSGHQSAGAMNSDAMNTSTLQGSVTAGPHSLGPLITLPDSLLANDPLLCQFLWQGLSALQQEAAAGGCCATHGGCPGPEDLRALEEKLQRQQDALVAQLQALGVHVPHALEVEVEAAAASAAEAARVLLVAQAGTSGTGRFQDGQEDAAGMPAPGPSAQPTPALGMSPARRHRRGLGQGQGHVPGSPLAGRHRPGGAAVEEDSGGAPGSQQALPPPQPQPQLTLQTPGTQQPPQQGLQQGSQPREGALGQAVLARLSEPMQRQVATVHGELQQVLQRMARISRARQHGLEAGATQLLNLLLRRCWRQLMSAQALAVLEEVLQHAASQRPALGRTDVAHQQGVGPGAEGAWDAVHGTVHVTVSGGGGATASRSLLKGQLGSSTMCGGAKAAGRSGAGAEGCTSQECTSERRAMRLQLVQLSLQLDDCQVAQQQLSRELADALDAAEASHAEAMEVSRAANTRVGELEHELERVRGEALEREREALGLRRLEVLEPEQGRLRELQQEVEELRALKAKAPLLATLEAEVALLRGEARALRECSPEKLQELVSLLEQALNAARAAQVQAASERELQCPVCWEERKGCVFQCGHQACRTCGEKLVACPICRQAITLRIRTFS